MVPREAPQASYPGSETRTHLRFARAAELRCAFHGAAGAEVAFIAYNCLRDA